jgi:hypothetical protein
MGTKESERKRCGQMNKNGMKMVSVENACKE